MTALRALLQYLGTLQAQNALGKLAHAIPWS